MVGKQDVSRFVISSFRQWHAVKTKRTQLYVFKPRALPVTAPFCIQKYDAVSGFMLGIAPGRDFGNNLLRTNAA